MITMISPTCNCNHTFSPLNLICAKICKIIYIISFSLKYKMLTMLQNSILQHNHSTLCDGSQTHLSLRYLTSTVLLAVCKSQSCPLHRTWHLNIHQLLCYFTPMLNRLSNYFRKDINPNGQHKIFIFIINNQLKSSEISLMQMT